jgi:hypothetical protein
MTPVEGRNRLTKWTCLLAVPLALMPVAPSVTFAQQAAPTQAEPAAPAYTQAELEQILAPIALIRMICWPRSWLPLPIRWKW